MAPPSKQIANILIHQRNMGLVSQVASSSVGEFLFPNSLRSIDQLLAVQRISSEKAPSASNSGRGPPGRVRKKRRKRPSVSLTTTPAGKRYVDTVIIDKGGPGKARRIFTVRN
jgi:hypothetical protein